MNSLEIGSGDALRKIAYAENGKGRDDLTIVWLGGYRSDMTGTKAVVLEDYATKNDLHFLRFDYSGHGASSGHYTEGTISRWCEDALGVIRAKARKRLVLVGSSMGGWVALRLIQLLKGENLPHNVVGMVLIAPAPDFTSALIEPHLGENERKSLVERGYFEEISEYSPEPNRYTKLLLDDGRNNLVMTGLIDPGCPVHILQGMKDPDVPYTHALKIMEKIVADDAVLTLIRDGDHRLSRPEDLERITAALEEILAAISREAVS